MSLPVMIFAAGRGARMGALTAHCPKPLMQVDGRALLDHALDQARAVGAGPIVINTHHHADQIAAHLAGQGDIRLSHEPELLDTGGGLKSAIPLLGAGIIATLNADALWRQATPLAQLLAAFDPHRMDALLLLAPQGTAHSAGAGDFFLNGNPGHLRRRGAAAHAPYIHTGAQIINTAWLAEIHDRVFSMNRLWDMLIAENRAFGLPMQGAWRDVGTPEALTSAQGWRAG